MNINPREQVFTARGNRSGIQIPTDQKSVHDPFKEIANDRIDMHWNVINAGTTTTVPMLVPVLLILTADLRSRWISVHFGTWSGLGYISVLIREATVSLAKGKIFFFFWLLALQSSTVQEIWCGQLNFIVSFNGQPQYKTRMCKGRTEIAFCKVLYIYIALVLNAW